MRTLPALWSDGAEIDHGRFGGLGPVERSATTLALTFDDGPEPMRTPIMRDDGHRVELHCRDHARHSQSAREMVEVATDHASTNSTASACAPLAGVPLGGLRALDRAVARRGLG